MSATAHDVAALLINEQLRSHRSIDTMQLQKLLYLAQGANLEFWGEPAFKGLIRAYRNGPVEAGVERSYRHVVAGVAPIPGPVGGHPGRLSETVVDTVQTVLGYFGSWPAGRLERHVKQAGSPWRRARGDLPDNASSSTEIPLADIARWFALHGVDPNLKEEEHWTATAAERAAADVRLRRAKELGAYVPEVPDEIAAIVDRAVASATD